MVFVKVYGFSSWYEEGPKIRELMRGIKCKVLLINSFFGSDEEFAPYAEIIYQLNDLDSGLVTKVAERLKKSGTKFDIAYIRATYFQSRSEEFDFKKLLRRRNYPGIERRKEANL